MEKFKNSRLSKDGRMNIRIEKELSDRLREFCQVTDKNITKTVNEVLASYLDSQDIYEQMTKEQLIGLIKHLKGNGNDRGKAV